MLGIKDILLTPVYLFIIYIIAFIYRSKFVKNKEDKKYFLPALSLKIIGAIFLGLIYQFYYSGGGDTTNYYNDISVIYEAFFKDPQIAVKLITYNYNDNDPKLELVPYISNMVFDGDAPSFFVVRIGAILSLFTFGTYTLISIGFAIISFICLWCFYIATTSLYPENRREFAMSIFFIPSVFFWGSGLMKDSLTLAAVGLTFYAFYKIFLAPKSQKKYIFFLLLGLFVLKSIKIYIILCLIPALLVYLYIEYNRKIKSRFLQLVLKPLLLIISIGFAYFAVNELTKNNSSYNIEKLAQTARRTSDWINYVSELQGGSSYTLGDYDATFTGILEKAPAAVWVTLFRPYLWESKNIIMLFSALESSIFLILTLRALIKLGISGLIKAIRKNTYIQFALVFCIPFAFGIGISTYNFGSLVRYKIPIMSFYISSIFILTNQAKKNAKQMSLPNTKLHS